MKSKFVTAALVAAVAAPMIASAPAQAQYYGGNGYGYGYDNGYRGYRDAQYGRGYYRDGPYRDGYRQYRGRDARYYQDCRRSSGTTGAIAGGAGGAILGSVLGGGTLGTVLGAVGGGLLGRDLDKKHDAAQNYRNGC